MPKCGIPRILVHCERYKTVVEKNDEDELLIYFADRDGARLNNISYGTKNVAEYANSVLKAVLLKNSNIREALPELEIDDNVNLDTRQLKCWINNTSTIQKITDESFKDSVRDLLKSDPEFINSVKGERGPQGPVGKDGKHGPQDQKEIKVTTMQSRSLLCKKEKNYWMVSVKQILF